MTDDLITWLRAQLDADERVARAATPGPWVWLAGRVFQEHGDDRIVVPTVNDLAVVEPEDLAHIARHDPARVLAEVQAKRRLVSEAEHYLNYEDHGLPLAEWILTFLALPYADVPGYRDEWRP